MRTKTVLFNSLPYLLLLIICSLPLISSAQFVESIGGGNAEYGQGITSDLQGNIYVIGDFRGKADFDPGAGTFYLKSDGSSQSKPDIFFAKYSKDGALVWAGKAGGDGSDFGKGIGVDAVGNVYITGTFERTADFDPSANTLNLTSNGSSDIFLAKYDSTGRLLWADGIGGVSPDIGNSLSADAKGNTTIAGSFSGNVDFNPGRASTFLDAGSSSDPFFARYDSVGNLVWVKDIAGNGESAAQNIFTDASGFIYLTGNFFGTADFDPNEGTFSLTGVDAKDAFFARYNKDGNLLWAGSIGGPGDQAGQSITADNSGNVYVTGYFIGTVDFNPGSGVFNLSSTGNFNAYLLKLNSKGKFVWANNIGGLQDDIGFSVATDAKQNIYATGYFNGIAHFDSAITLTSTGSTDIYVAMYDPSGKLVLAQKSGGTTDDWASAIATDASGNAYLTGYFTGTATFSILNAKNTLISAGDADVYFLKFTTPGNNYCSSKGINSGKEWISLVFLSDMYNSSGNDGGYHDYTNRIATIAAGAFYDITTRAGFAGNAQHEAWSVWIDYNKDGDFNDSGELVARYRSNSRAQEIHPFSAPFNASGTTTRMRVVMNRDFYNSPCDTFNMGEVEDYTIKILPQSNIISAVNQNAVINTAVSVIVSPNPVKDVLTITAPSVKNKVLLRICDASGRIVLTEEMETLDHAKIKVGSLSKGLYILKITGQNTSCQAVKFLKE